jgi:hypothetical protein
VYPICVQLDPHQTRCLHGVNRRPISPDWETGEGADTWIGADAERLDEWVRIKPIRKLAQRSICKLFGSGGSHAGVPLY